MRALRLLATMPWLLACAPTAENPWGAHGHRIAAEAAAEALPEAMPDFFTERADQLVYLNPEPDRWRDGRITEMDRGFAFDHYIDLERVPPRALETPDRWTYVETLHREGLEHPARDAGFLPFRILELHQRLVTEWRLWRGARTRDEHQWIEDRIVNDAGILGHYVTDASQPHHTTIHFNGWDSKSPNPEGFTDDRDFHARFEAAFVGAHVRQDDVAAPLISLEARRFTNVRRAVWSHIRESHSRVVDLYRLDRDVGFDPDRGDPRTQSFTVERLVSGARMLRDLWWTAWLESERP